MSQTTAQAPKKEKVGIGAWIALVVLIVILSGVFRTSDTPLKVLDFTNLSGSFGTIGDTGANFIGSGGSGAKDGFMAGLNLIPAVMLFCGLLGVFEQLGAFKASDILFRPLLRPILGIPGSTGVAFISSFTGSDVAAVIPGTCMRAAASPTTSAPSSWLTSMLVRPASTTPSPAARRCWPSAPSAWALSSSSSSSAS